MRFIIYGAGAIGGVIGARLFQEGFPVVLIARGAHHKAIQSQGLILESPHEVVTLPIPVVKHPAEINFEAGDVVMLAMKSQHTVAALEALRNATGDEIPVVCCQNGVFNEREAARIFQHVYGMAVLMPAAHLEPGVVQTTTTGVTGVVDCGVYPHGIDDTITELAAALELSNFVCRADPAIMRMKYAKLLMNLGNALQAACGSPPEARDLIRQARDEALACYAAAQIDSAPREEFQARFLGKIEEAPIHGQARSGGSSWQSLKRGTGSIEADYLNGEIVLLGRLYGVATPANHALQQIANEMAFGGAEPGSVPVDIVSARIRELEAEVK
jgi:2-dehydropantoate 2-reductase